MSRARANADATSQTYIENATAAQTLSGTYSTERLYFNDSYQLTGNVTVTGHLALGTIADEDVVITNDGTERTITGSGTLESGELLKSEHSDLTGMTGELGSAVTGSPAITGFGTVTSGTIGNALTGVNQKIMGFSAYLSDDKQLANATWTEIQRNGNGYANGSWVEFFDSDGKFTAGEGTGRFTPTVAGVYHCGYVAHNDEIDDSERIIGAIRVNGVESATTEFAKFQNRSTGTNITVSAGGSALIELNTSDYVSLWCYQDSGANERINSGTTKFWGYYVGTV
jgi:hypothetical protein